MDLNKVKEYKISEHTVLSDTDKRHIENYQQLIRFFENAIDNSIKEDSVSYKSLHSSCIQCIRFLDNLIYTFDGSVKGVRMLNETLDKIVSDNKPTEKEGNEANYQSPI